MYMLIILSPDCESSVIKRTDLHIGFSLFFLGHSFGITEPHWPISEEGLVKHVRQGC